jgi:hypothetical protein
MSRELKFGRPAHVGTTPLGPCYARLSPRRLVSTSPKQHVALGSEKRSLESEKNLTQIGNDAFDYLSIFEEFVKSARIQPPLLRVYALF